MAVAPVTPHYKTRRKLALLDELAQWTSQGEFQKVVP